MKRKIDFEVNIDAKIHSDSGNIDSVGNFTSKMISCFLVFNFFNAIKIILELNLKLSNNRFLDCRQGELAFKFKYPDEKLLFLYNFRYKVHQEHHFSGIKK